MTELKVDEMKKIVGGVEAPPDPGSGSWCSTTFNCSDGSSQTLTCPNAEAGCVGVDASSNPNGDGYGYCEQNGTIDFSQCGV